MSCILEALRRAERKLKRERTTEDAPIKSSSTQAFAESTEWGVEMVSPVRFIRHRINVTKAAERTSQAATGLSRGLIVAVTLLSLLTFFICVTAYNIQRRVSTISTELNEMTRHVNQTGTQMAKLDAERLRLDLENRLLRQENEAAGAELARPRGAFEGHKVRQRATTKQSARRVAVQKAGPPVPPAREPHPTIDAPPSLEQLPVVDTIETPFSKAYAIR